VEIPGPSTYDATSGPLHASPQAARLLAVDKDPQLLAELEKCLTASPQLFSIRTTGNGQIAMRVLAEYQPHVVLLDPAMPGPAGLALCRQISSSARREMTRILALVRQSDQKLMALADEYGIAACLNRYASMNTIKYEVWRLAQEVTKLEGQRDAAALAADYRSVGEASHKMTHPKSPGA
jgi:PleD family two-component response regulator